MKYLCMCPADCQAVFQEQEQVMKQEQQVKVDGGGSAAAGMEQSGDIPSTEITPTASLNSQQSDADDVSASLALVGMTMFIDDLCPKSFVCFVVVILSHFDWSVFLVVL